MNKKEFEKIDKIVFINILKGIAVFLMLWGHCIQYLCGEKYNFFNNLVFKTIYSFHMPLFMLISGYLFYFSYKKKDVKTLLIHRAQPLLQAMLSYSVIYFIFVTCLFYLFKQGNWRILFSGVWIDNLKAVWFLWSVLVASLGVGLICKNIKSNYLRGLCLVLWGG